MGQALRNCQIFIRDTDKTVAVTEELAGFLNFRWSHQVGDWNLGVIFDNLEVLCTDGVPSLSGKTVGAGKGPMYYPPASAM
jgi:hypothetical protein